MSTSLTYFYFFLAAIGTLLFFFDPSSKLQKFTANKTSDEVNEGVKDWIGKSDDATVTAKGCGIVLFIALGLLYAFVIDPIAAISAITNHRGNMYIAIGVLVIVVMQLLHLIYAIKTRKKKRTKKFTRPVANSDNGSGKEMLEVVDVLKTSNPVWLFVRRVFYSLPEFYLWYIFLVGIGVFSQG